MTNHKRPTVLITGTSRGIGKATALKMLEEGYQVIGTATTEAGNVIRHPAFTGLKLDLSSVADIKAFPERLKAVTSGPDILINNAGVGDDVPFSEPEATTMDHTFKVNVYGLVLLTEALLPYMQAGSQIWMLSSAMSLMENIEPNGPAYRMSKAAVNVYVKMLSQRVASRNIIVNALEPGWVKTDMGGIDAPVTPEEAAAFIYHTVRANKQNGHFWLSTDRSSFSL